jgi:hypothetical protein
MPEERERLITTENEVGPRMDQAQQGLMRMRLATMEVPRYYDRQAPFISERSDATTVKCCKCGATAIAYARG